MSKNHLFRVVTFVLMGFVSSFVGRFGWFRVPTASCIRYNSHKSANNDMKKDNATSVFSRPSSTTETHSSPNFSYISKTREILPLLSPHDKFSELRNVTNGNTLVKPRQLDPMKYALKFIGNYGALDESFKWINKIARVLSLLLSPDEDGASPGRLDHEAVFFTAMDILYSLEMEKTYGKVLIDLLTGDVKEEFQERIIRTRSKISSTYHLHEREIMFYDLLIARVERIILLFKLEMIDKNITSKTNLLNEPFISENEHTFVKHTAYPAVEEIHFYLLWIRCSSVAWLAPRNVTYEEAINTQHFLSKIRNLIDTCESYLELLRTCRNMYNMSSPNSMLTDDLLLEWLKTVINSSFEDPIVSTAHDWFNDNTSAIKPVKQIKDFEIDNTIRLPRTAANRFLFSTIDAVHRYDYGIRINKEQAKTLKYKVASEVLNFDELALDDTLEVVDGAAICRGTTWKYANNGTIVTNLISSQLEALNLTDCVDFIVMNSQVELHRFVRIFFELTPLVKANVILQTINLKPVVIFYPKQWKLAVARDARRPWEKLVNAASTGVAVANMFRFCLLQSTTNTDNLSTLIDVKQMLIMTVASLVLMFVPPKIEQIVALKHGVKIQPTLIPSTFGLLHMGYKSKIFDLTMNKTALFDITASGVGSGLVLSLLCLTLGLFLTSNTSPDTITNLPEMSERLLNINVQTQFLSSWVMSNSNQPVLMTFGDVTRESHIHLHGLAIIGVMSFIGYTLQLYPANNGHLYKLITACTKGAATPAIIAATNNFLFFCIAVAAFITPDKLPMLLILELLTKSWICSDSDDRQIVRDGLTTTDEGRKMIVFLSIGIFFMSILCR